MKIQLTYHAQARLAARTTLSLTDAAAAYTKGLPLPKMPKALQGYLTRRMDRYSGHRYVNSQYRLYKGFILVYRVHPEGGLALVTTLVPPEYTLRD